MSEEMRQNGNYDASNNNTTTVIIGATSGLSVNDGHVVINEPHTEESVKTHSTEAQSSTSEAKTTSESNSSSSSKSRSLLTYTEVEAINSEIKSFAYKNTEIYPVIAGIIVALVVLLGVLSSAFGNMDASIAIYVCTAIAAIGIFLIYMVVHMAKQLFKLNRKYQLKKLALLIDYAKNINKE